MNERIQALRGCLPNGVLGLISMYDCHPTADLMKAVRMLKWDKVSLIPAGMQLYVDEPHYFIDPTYGRLQSKGLYFPIWSYATHPDMIYLADWAVEEYLEERLAVWLDRWKK